MAQSAYQTLYKGLMNINEDGCQPYGRFGLDGDWCIKCDTPTVSTGVGIWCTYPLLGIPTLPPKRTWEQRYLPPQERTWDQRYPTPSRGQTHTCENVTYPQLHWRVVNIYSAF